MTAQLKVSSELSFPLDVASQAVGIFGIRGGGKTNTASVMAEELLAQGQPTVVIDPTDAWWGLRSGFPVFIFGGPHGDLPLQETDGKVLAEFVVTEQVPVILSLRHLRKGAQRRFVTEFCEELYHLKGKDENRTPLTVFIDEAPLFVPQKVTGDVARTVGAVEDLIARGRNSGFGVVLISQRPATLNTDVRSQCDTIITHRVTGTHDRKALADWIEENASVEKLKEVLSSLATLPDGRAWVWSPRLDIMKQVQMRMRKTFDSSATPKRGEQPKQPKRLEEIDLGKLKDKLAASVEKAKKEDPKLLRARIAELEKLAARVVVAATPSPAVPGKASITAEYRALEQRLRAAGKALESAMKFIATVRTIGFPEKIDAKKLETAITAAVQRVGDQINTEFGAKRKAFDKWQADGEKLLASIESLLKAEVPIDVTVKHNEPYSVQAKAPPASAPRTSRAPAQPMEGVSRSQQKILESLAMLEGMGITQPSRTQLALWAEVSPTSGGYFNNLGALRTGSLIDYPSGGTVSLTDAGRARTPAPEPMSVEDMQASLCAKVGPAKAAILRAAIDIYPNAIGRDELAEKIGVSPTSGGYFNNLGALRTLGVIDYPSPKNVVALPVLFLERA